MQNKDRTNWQKKKARRDHTTMQERAKELIISDRKIKKMEQKWERKKQRVQEATIVMDSVATSTVIRAEDEQYINSTNEPSTKVFYNANGTLSRAGNKATLRYNLQSSANEADMVPSLSMNSLMSTSK
jgi:hypothetical protein